MCFSVLVARPATSAQHVAIPAGEAAHMYTPPLTSPPPAAPPVCPPPTHTHAPRGGGYYIICETTALTPFFMVGSFRIVPSAPVFSLSLGEFL